jgi:hypothetical protein
MIPSIDTRLASMLSTLAGVIAPALGSDQPFASEQAGLLMAHLGLLRAQEPMTEEFEQLDYNRSRAFARELVASVDDARAEKNGAATRTAASELRKLLEGPVPFSQTSLRAAQDSFATRICALLEAVGTDGSPATNHATEEITLRYELAQSIRYRSYFSMMGYENGSREIPAPEAMMAEFRKAYGEAR